jgi:hypothetical protein
MIEEPVARAVGLRAMRSVSGEEVETIHLEFQALTRGKVSGTFFSCV